MKKMQFKICVPLFVLAVTLRCGTTNVDDPGRCKALSASTRVAPSKDESGDWTLEVTNYQTITCKAASNQTLTVYAKILDGAKTPKGGLLVKFDVNGTLKLDEESSDTQTDACGVASAVMTFKCPAAGASATGSYLGMSGAISSAVYNVTLQGQ